MSTAPTRTRRRQLKQPRMSLERYLSGPPDEFKSELIYGVLVKSPSPTDWHQDHQLDLASMLRRWVRAYNLGWVWHDLDMVLDEFKALVYGPDLLFLAKEHANRRKRHRLFGPADLAVEILSPSVRPQIVNRKFSDYERYGVTWYWVIEAKEQSLVEYQLVHGIYVARTEVSGGQWFAPGIFPGLQFRLDAVLRGDLNAAVKGKAKRLM